MMEKDILHKHEFKEIWSFYIKIFACKQRKLIRIKKDQEDRRILNVYANNWTSKYIKQKLTGWKGEIEKFIIIIKKSNTALSLTYGTNRGKISKDIEDLNVTRKQMNLIDIYRILYQQ